MLPQTWCKRRNPDRVSSPFFVRSKLSWTTFHSASCTSSPDVRQLKRLNSCRFKPPLLSRSIWWKISVRTDLNLPDSSTTFESGSPWGGFPLVTVTSSTYKNNGQTLEHFVVVVRNSKYSVLCKYIRGGHTWPRKKIAAVADLGPTQEPFGM